MVIGEINNGRARWTGAETGRFSLSGFGCFALPCRQAGRENAIKFVNVNCKTDESTVFTHTFVAHMFEQSNELHFLFDCGATWFK